MKVLRRARLLALLAIVVPIAALQADRAKGRKPIPMSVPHDWSHRHVMYSAPASVEHAKKLQQQARYWHQWLRRKDPPLKPAFSTDAWLRRIISEGDHPDQNDSLAN